jgi:hypothetical protein
MDSDVTGMLWAAHQRPGGTGSGLLQVKNKGTVGRDRGQCHLIYENSLLIDLFYVTVEDIMHFTEQG